MNTTRQLLEAVKQRHGLPTDYQLAKFLGISRQNVSNGMHGATMSDKTALLVADALGLPREHVMAIVAAERAKSEQIKKAWQRAAAATAAVVLVVLGADQAGQVLEYASAASPALYIMLNAAAATLAAAALVRFCLTDKVPSRG